jgi:uncharacterized protein YprB with RNaseH-like and TPR domain
MKRKQLRVPVERLKKIELLKISQWKCRHSHTGLEHYSCWLQENPDEERIGIFDIETSNLKADYGIMLSYAILNVRTDEVIGRAITKDELFSQDIQPDYHIITDCVADLRKFDRIVGFFSGDYKFDLPFVRTRAVSQDIDFPGYGSIYFEDVWTVIKSKFCLSSNRLVNASRVITGETQKTNWGGKYWTRAIQGNQKALDYIFDHNVRDVQDLKRLYLKVYPFTKHTNKSI